MARACSFANGHGGGNGTGSANGATASSKQLDYVQQLVKQIPGLGVRRLDAVSQKMHDKPVAGLTSIEASALIDLLRDLKAGRINVAAVLHGAAA